MYAIRIMYPRTKGSTFNLRHYLDVHTPLGLNLLKSTTGIEPARVEVDAEPIPLGPEDPPYHCASNLYFAELSHVEAFKSLFAREDTAKQLADDFPNYTTNHPVISVFKVLEIDPVKHVPR
ncbi:MAG TPA: EthD family reductase [Phenylobacterium sp.]|uniref:EthD family reductase n=1 Tax=Phenylobacterium sp. TaxID=1871053 RepID=UPI002B49B723|nr:EthD family reductase [Phenylobacterium sp.]HKR88592.1 EthD family reductase [Phenylobacterium sp.]